jgi:hypothetical protein
MALNEPTAEVQITTVIPKEKVKVEEHDLRNIMGGDPVIVSVASGVTPEVGIVGRPNTPLNRNVRLAVTDENMDGAQYFWACTDTSGSRSVFQVYDKFMGEKLIGEKRVTRAQWTRMTLDHPNSVWVRQVPKDELVKIAMTPEEGKALEAKANAWAVSAEELRSGGHVIVGSGRKEDLVKLSLQKQREFQRNLRKEATAGRPVNRPQITRNPGELAIEDLIYMANEKGPIIRDVASLPLTPRVREEAGWK